MESADIMNSQFQNPSLEEIRTLLQESKTIAVVGLSPKAQRPSHSVSRAMQSFGKRIIPVRPAVEEVLGETAYSDLESIPADIMSKIDIVDVFRAPEKISPVIDSCISLEVPCIWLQDGVINEAEALRAKSAGIKVIMDRCIYRDYVQLIE